MRKLIIAFCIILMLLLISCGEKPPDRGYTTRPIVLEDPIEECARVNGEWKTFEDTCVDSCFRARSEETPMCGMALTDSCDCGPDRCWNGYTCEDN